MPELASLEMDELSWIEGVVSEFRTHNRYWLTQGVLFPVGDLPDGAYWGPDKELFRLCLEIRAISWKMTELRNRIGEMPQTISDSNSEISIEWDKWEDRHREYREFFEIAEPPFDNRLQSLADAKANTLRGLAAKAHVIESEILGCGSDDQTALTRTLRSLFRDIDTIMGVDR